MSNEEFFVKFFMFKVGNGKWIRFWKDVWLWFEPLEVWFSEIFRISNASDRFITNLWTIDGWNLDLHLMYIGGILECSTREGGAPRTPSSGPHAPLFFPARGVGSDKLDFSLVLFCFKIVLACL